MITKGTILIIASFALISFIQISCKGENGNDAPGVSKSSSAKEATYKDPFAYCAAVGTIDTPDSRYVGPKIPDTIVLRLKEAFGAPEGIPRDVFERVTYWRCMGGKVYACNVGANLPCTEKADTSRVPNQGMNEWCKSNPDSDFIPAYASGRSTVYEWKCTAGEAQIVKEINKPDAAGYISNIWYEIGPK